MEIQLSQIAYLGLYLIIFFFIYKSNNKYVRYPLILVVLIMFFVNPVRMTATPINQLERGVSRFDDVPEKIIVGQPSFDDFNKSEIDKLNKLYRESRNEIHN